MSARSIIVYLLGALLLLQCNSKDPLSGARPVLEKIKIADSEKIFLVGEKYQFRAFGEFSKTQSQDITFSVNWTSSDTNRVKINAKTGVANFFSTGQAHITAVSTGEEGQTIQNQFEFEIFSAVKLHAGIQPKDLAITSDSKWAIFTDATKVYSAQLSGLIPTRTDSTPPLAKTTESVTLSNNERIAYVLSTDKKTLFAINSAALPQLSLAWETSSSINIVSIYSDINMDSAFVTLSNFSTVMVFKSATRVPSQLPIGIRPFGVGGKVGTKKLVVIDEGVAPPKVWIHSFYNNSNQPSETDGLFAQDYSIWPHPASNKVYIIAGVNRLYLLPLDNPLNMLRALSLGEDPQKIAFSTLGNKAYIVTNFGNVLVFDASRDEYIYTIDKRVPNVAIFPELGLAHDVKIKPNSDFAYILASDRDGSATQKYLYKYDIENRKLIRAVSIPGQPTFLKISPDGRWLLTLDKAVKGEIYALPVF